MGNCLTKNFLKIMNSHQVRNIYKANLAIDWMIYNKNINSRKTIMIIYWNYKIKNKLINQWSSVCNKDHFLAADLNLRIINNLHLKNLFLKDNKIINLNKMTNKQNKVRQQII